ncbi:hypothetical protein U27_02259 [Candidatus Vecturithrix granuli]|uniref:Guanylate cyclase domain-containing protein n=1 Tax=Vecturithrix granuli TaxID=1499967 RepID=A0A0S6WA94_VECG1|nr:hypothetical protein U27_02259 [Candidatus Vecturithrix granuli]
MNTQTTVFDQCRTREQIQAQLQRLVQELVFPAQAQSPQTTENAVHDRGMPVDLRVLADVSYTDLKERDHPVFLISEICRLLIKMGERESLRQCLALSHQLYPFKCQRNESWHISALYKGIAQIGLSQTDLGIKNVSIGLSGQEVFSIAALDRALGYWALMSAAVANKNLKLARVFSEKWLRSSEEGALEQECRRAKLTMLLLALLFGDQETCVLLAEELKTSPFDEWQDAGNTLLVWTYMLKDGQYRPGSDGNSPYPLLLGVSWPENACSGAEDEQAAYSGEFSNLCALRRSVCRPEIARTLPTDLLEKYADFLAQWELAGPLCELEMVLKERDHEQAVQGQLSRVLGESILHAILNKNPVEPPVVRQSDAIILVTDARQFSTLSEQRNPEEIFDLLNPVFKILSEELEPIGGTILEFIGDSIILVFNTFPQQHTEIMEILIHTIRSLMRIYVLNAMSQQSARPDIRLGVGINRGPVALGYLGGLKRCHLTVLGNTINLAARLESASKELPGDVIVSAACFENNRPDVWAAPLRVNFCLRDLGQQYHPRNIATPVHLFGLRPLLPYWVDFVPMGFVACPEKGVVYLDTGNANCPGIIDHHFEGCQANSACELLLRIPELLLEHIQGLSRSQLEFRLHHAPDLDCAAALYAASELLAGHPRTEILRQLSDYVSLVDQARLPLPHKLSHSLYGIFQAHQRLSLSAQNDVVLSDLCLLEAGLRVIDAAVYLLQQHPEERNFASIFQFQPTWFAAERQLLEEDQVCYAEDVQCRSHQYIARVNGLPEPAVGLWLDHPQSVFFKLWGWNDPNAPGGNGYAFLAVDLSTSDKNRFMIGVDPARDLNLQGLGQLLEAHEARKRKLIGKERPIHPIRYPADNSDPWYFGQGHNYAVIDAPGEGTVLSAAEVQRIHENWQNT